MRLDTAQPIQPRQRIPLNAKGNVGDCRGFAESATLNSSPEPGWGVSLWLGARVGGSVATPVASSASIMRISPVSVLCLTAFLNVACGSDEGRGDRNPGDGSGVGGADSGSGGAQGTGSTTGDGGTVNGTGATTGSGGGNGSGVGCAGADIVCDDFEGGSIDAAKWRTVAATSGGADAAHDSTKGYESTSSVRFDDQGQVGRFLTSQAAFPDEGKLYVRAYMNFENATTAMSGHTGFIVGATTDSNGQELRWGQSMAGCNAPNQLLDLNHIPTDKTICSSGHITGGNPTDAPDPDGVTLAADTWYCVETFWDSTVGEFRLWIDDEEVTVLHAAPGLWCPIGQPGCNDPDPWPMAFTLVKFGTQVYNGGAGSIWYDDVAYATQRIGCD